MYVVGKRLKKRHNILDDARQSLYNEVNYFLNTLNGKGTRFIGGEEPNLADLAIYGCISSIDGNILFQSTIFKTHTNVRHLQERARLRILCTARGYHLGKLLYTTFIFPIYPLFLRFR